MQIDRKAFWRKQVLRTVVLLAIWAVTGFGLSILFVEQMNEVMLGDMPLGFWMAHQGSIYIFIVLILVYAVLGDRADKKAGLDLSRPGRAVAPDSSSPPSSSPSA